MKLKITVHGVAYDVDVEVLDPGEGFSPRAGSLPAPPGAGAPSSPPSRAAGAPARPTSLGSPSPGDDGHAVASPIAGVVTEIRCKPGDSLAQGDVLLIIEAMKMNNTITAPTAGRVKAIVVAAGDSVREGQTLVELE